MERQLNGGGAFFWPAQNEGPFACESLVAINCLCGLLRFFVVCSGRCLEVSSWKEDWIAGSWLFEEEIAIGHFRERRERNDNFYYRSSRSIERDRTLTRYLSSFYNCGQLKPPNRNYNSSTAIRRFIRPPGTASARQFRCCASTEPTHRSRIR